jgi:Xaa-Pro aminopeptidase
MMRSLTLVLSAGLCLAGITKEEYRERRAVLRKALPGGAVVVLLGNTETEKGDLRTTFIQDANFLYFTGWREPGAALVMTPEQDALFLPERNEVRERYTGRKLAAGDSEATETTGFDHVYPMTELQSRLTKIPGPIYTLTKGPQAEQVRQLSPGRELREVSKEATRLRMVKSPAEIELIQRSVDVTVESHTAAWKRAAPGLFEYQIAATMGQTYFDRGCERNAYPPIVASGPNSVILHYSANRRRMDNGELLLMDVGAECSDYAADVTRTIPVSGKFTPRQREIYDVVLGAQKAAIAAAKPGMKLLGMDENSLNGIAYRYANSHGRDRDGQPLGKYYLHGLGHHVGLEVHDPADPDVELQPGMVITIEPGIYIAGERIGIRIEDVVLITETGAKVLSQALAKEAKEVERALVRRTIFQASTN